MPDQPFAGLVHFFVILLLYQSHHFQIIFNKMRFTTIFLLCLLALNAVMFSMADTEEAKAQGESAVQHGKEAGKEVYESGKEKLNEAGEKIGESLTDLCV